MSSAVAVGAAIVVAWLLVGSPRAQRHRLAVAPARPRWVVQWSGRRLVAGATAGLVGWLIGELVFADRALILAAACAGLGFWWFGRLEPRRVRSRQVAAAEGLPITLEMLAACVEAGAPLRGAVRQVSDLAPEGTSGTLARLDAAVRLGVDEATAWRGLVDDPLWGAIARDLVRSIETGVPAREVLQEHAAEIRTAGHDARLTRARAVGVSSTLPLMLCFLPAFLLLGVVPIVEGLIPQLP